MGIKFKNNAVSVLTGSLTTLSTDILINAADDGKYPVIAAIGADYFYLTLEDEDHNIETVKIVRHVSGSNNLETDGTADSGVNRGLDGTTARAWDIGDVVEVRPNALALEEAIATADNHIADATSAHAASAISNTPVGNIAATDVQVALNELDSEKAKLAGATSQAFACSNLAFPATQAASADPNTLDDYDEGTWTPTLGGTATYSVQTGVYIKIGKLVYVFFNLAVTTIGTGSTTNISGLPFNNSDDGMNGVAFSLVMGLGTACVNLIGKVTSAEIINVQGTAAAATTFGGIGVITSGTQLMGTAFYRDVNS